MSELKILAKWINSKRFESSRIDLKINAKKIKSLILRINDFEGVLLGNEKINRADSFAYLGSIISKTMNAVKMLKAE